MKITVIDNNFSFDACNLGDPRASSRDGMKRPQVNSGLIDFP